MVIDFRKKLRVCPRTLLHIAAMITLCWLAGFAAFSFHISTIGEKLNKPADVIIVLTGGAGRISRGLDLLSRHEGAQVFITGVNSMVTMADIMHMWQGNDPDIVTCCVTLGHQAHNTRQNAAEARKWITGVQGIRSARLVTSNYHMPRAMLEFRQALPGIRLIPSPVAYGGGPDHDKRNFWLLSFAEYNKTLLTWLRVALTPSREMDLP